MGGAKLARAALATVALSAPAVGMLAPSAVAATAAPLAASPMPSTTQQLQAWNALRHPARHTFNQLAAAYAVRLEGVPYVYGGTSLRGFDCSGLTQYVYHHLGKGIERTADNQFHQFRRISRAQARPGDLIFFHVSGNPRSYVYHVGVYEGGNYMVAATTTGGRVTRQSYTWAGDTVTFGTISH
ncbi:MAG TPA: C40 family peptidase [Trebonia sp.]|nr:C40 family peptidase [Trebonia sp.]